jgi:hypothetical protein
MSDSHIRPMITPTITMKASVVTEFPDLQEEVEHIQILKLNIASKVLKSIQNNRNERKYAHLNNCNEITLDKNYSTYDYWPIPDEVDVNRQQDQMFLKQSIQTIYIKNKPTEFLDGDYFKEIKEKPIHSLFDSIDRLFDLVNFKKIYDQYQITNHKFLSYLESKNLWSEKWINNPK